jgi:hypothetical protein
MNIKGIQAGITTASSNQVITFPTPFPAGSTVVVTINPVFVDTSLSACYATFVYNVTTTSFQYQSIYKNQANIGASTTPQNWIAIAY